MSWLCVHDGWLVTAGAGCQGGGSRCRPHVFTVGNGRSKHLAHAAGAYSLRTDKVQEPARPLLPAAQRPAQALVEDERKSLAEAQEECGEELAVKLAAV